MVKIGANGPIGKAHHTHNPVDGAKGSAEALLAMQKEMGLEIRM